MPAPPTAAGAGPCVDHGCLFLETQGVVGLKVDKEGPWAVSVQASWQASTDLSQLPAPPEWWKAHTTTSPPWTCSPSVIEAVPNDDYEEEPVNDEQQQIPPEPGQEQAPSAEKPRKKTHTLTGDVKLSLRSTLFPLQDSSLTLLVNTSLKLELLGSSHGSPSESLGVALVPVRDLVLGSFCQDIQVPVGDSGAIINVRYYLDDETASFCIGSCVLQVEHAQVSTLTGQWALPAPPETPAEELHNCLAQLATGPLGERQAYTMVIPDDATTTTTTTKKATPLFPTVSLGGGKLSYTPPYTEGVSGTWGVVWSAGPSFWLSSGSYRQLQAAVSQGQPLPIRFNWKGVIPLPPEPTNTKGKKGGKPTGPQEKEVQLSATSDLSLDSFMHPGVRSTSLESPLDEESPSSTNDSGRQPYVSIRLTISKPLVEVVPDVIPSLQPLDVLPARELAPKKPPRDVEVEFQQELSEVVRTLAHEYVKAFVVNTKNNGLSTEDKRKRFFYQLNKSGMYHDLKEKLKPRIQRLVRKRFTHAPADDHERDEFVSRLYTTLIEQMNKVVNNKIKETRDANEDPLFEAPYGEVPKQSMQRIKELLMLATDAEANGRWDKALRYHEDRVVVARALEEMEEGMAPTVFETWKDLGEFALRAPLSLKLRLRARECLKEALSISTSDLCAVHLYASCLLEDGLYEEAKAVCEDLLKRNRATSITYSLLLLHADIGGDFVATKNYLQKAVAEFTLCLEQLGVPKRTTVVVLLDAADIFQRYNLLSLLKRALVVADRCEAAAIDKAKERKLPVFTPVHIRVKKQRLKAQLLLAQGELEAAAQEAQEAVDVNSTDGLSWSVLGDVKAQLGLSAEACHCFAKSLDALTRAGRQVPARIFVRLGDLYLLQSDLDRAKEVMLRCCAEYTLPTGWLKVGITCLKLNEVEDAEDALQEANVLDNRNPEVWGYLALLFLLNGDQRLHEATHALDEALRCNLRNSGLLRELANAHIAIDRLETAEDLLRRALVIEPSNLTKRMLADVLAAENALSAAAAQYEELWKSDEVTMEEKKEYGERYHAIVKSLGRESKPIQSGIAV